MSFQKFEISHAKKIQGVYLEHLSGSDHAFLEKLLSNGFKEEIANKALAAFYHANQSNQRSFSRFLSQLIKEKHLNYPVISLKDKSEVTFFTQKGHAPTEIRPVEPDEQTIESWLENSREQLEQILKNVLDPYLEKNLIGSKIKINFNPEFNQNKYVSGSDHDFSENPTSSQDFLEAAQMLLRESYERKQVGLLNHLFDEGDEAGFPIQHSYINLALLEYKQQTEDEHTIFSEASEFVRETLLNQYEDIYAKKTPIKLEKLFNNYQRILLQGRAGIGKSTLCQYITSLWAQPESLEDEIQQQISEHLQETFEFVFLVPLRALKTLEGLNLNLRDRKDLMRAVIDELCLNLTDTGAFDHGEIYDQISSGNLKALWLLDGYDELDLSNITAKKIWEMLSVKSNVLFTSRSHARCSINNVDANLELMGFTNEAIEKYVDQFAKDKISKNPSLIFDPNAFLRSLKQNKSIWTMCHIPIQLEMICSVLSATGTSSDFFRSLTVTELYNKLLEGLKEHYSEKLMSGRRLSKRKINLITKKSFQYLKALAYQGMRDKKILFDEIDLDKALFSPNALFTEKEIDVIDLETQKVFSLGFLKELERGRRQYDYYFLHLTLQEYCAAHYIADVFEKDDEEKKQELWDWLKLGRLEPQNHLMLQMVAGILETPQALTNYFDFLMAPPYDYVGMDSTLLLMSALNECKNPKEIQQNRDILSCFLEGFNFLLTLDKFSRRDEHWYYYRKMWEREWVRLSRWENIFELNSPSEPAPILDDLWGTLVSEWPSLCESFVKENLKPALDFTFRNIEEAVRRGRYSIKLGHYIISYIEILRPKINSELVVKEFMKLIRAQNNLNQIQSSSLIYGLAKVLILNSDSILNEQYLPFLLIILDDEDADPFAREKAVELLFKHFEPNHPIFDELTLPSSILDNYRDLYSFLSGMKEIEKKASLDEEDLSFLYQSIEERNFLKMFIALKAYSEKPCLVQGIAEELLKLIQRDTFDNVCEDAFFALKARLIGALGKQSENVQEFLALSQVLYSDFDFPKMVLKFAFVEALIEQEDLNWVIFKEIYDFYYEDNIMLEKIARKAFKEKSTLLANDPQNTSSVLDFFKSDESEKEVFFRTPSQKQYFVIDFLSYKPNLTEEELEFLKNAYLQEGDDWPIHTRVLRVLGNQRVLDDESFHLLIAGCKDDTRYKNIKEIFRDNVKESSAVGLIRHLPLFFNYLEKSNLDEIFSLSYFFENFFALSDRNTLLFSEKEVWLFWDDDWETYTLPEEALDLFKNARASEVVQMFHKLAAGSVK